MVSKNEVGCHLLKSFIVSGFCLAVVACSEAERSEDQSRDADINFASYTHSEIKDLVTSGNRDAAAEILRARDAGQVATSDDFLLLAEIYILQANGFAALDAIDRAQQKGATDQYVAALRAEALMMQGRFDDAEDTLGLISLVGPKGAKAALLTAKLAAENGDMTKARRYFGYARDLDPTSVDSDIALSLAELAAGNLELAAVVAQELTSNPATTHRHEPFYVLGAIERVQRNPAAAIEYLQIALNKKSADILSQMELVGAYLDSQQTELAQKTLDDALAQNPANPLGKFYVAYLDWQKGDYEKARDILKLENDLLASYRPAKILYANASYDAGEFEAAIPYFQEYLSEVPNDAPVRIKLSDSLARVGLLEEAKQTIASIVPEYADTPELAKNEDKVEALVDMQTRINVSALSQAAALDLSMSDAAAAKQKYEQALAYLQALPENNDDQRRFLTAALAEIEFRSGATEAGIKSMQAALGIGEPTLDQILALANMQLTAGQYEAVESILQTLPAGDEILPLRANLEGALAMRAGDHEAAISAFSRSILADPNYLSAIMNRALAYTEKQMFSDALEDLKSIEARANGDGQYYALLGRAHQGMGNYGAALDAYENGLKNLPTSSFLNANYALMLIQQKRYAEALPVAQKALEVLPANSPASGQIEMMIHDLKIAIDRASSRAD